MRPFQLLGAFVVVALAIGGAVRGGGANTSGTKEKEAQRGDCHDLMKKKPPKTPPSSFVYDCDLVESLNATIANISSSSDQADFENWLQQLQVTILANITVTESCTDDELFVLVAESLQAFLEVHVTVAEEINYLPVTNSSCGCSWGYIDDIRIIAVFIQSESAPQIIQPSSGSNSTDNCTLFESMREACQNSQEQQWVEELIARLEVIFDDESLSEQQMFAIAFQIMVEFIAENPSCKDFLMGIKIKGFGSFKSFYDVCHLHEQTVTISVVLTGSSGSDCELLQALNESVYNSSSTMSYGCKSQVNQLVGALQLYFQSNSDSLVRLSYCSQEIFQMLLQSPWCSSSVLTIQIGSWGTVSDLETCSNFCHEYNSCGCVDVGLPPSPSPTAGSSSPASASSAASSAASTPASSAASKSSAAPTTASTAAPTTSGPNCASRSNMCTPGITYNGTCSNCNRTALDDSITVVYNSWSFSLKSSFSGVLAKIRTILYSSESVNQKIDDCYTQLTNYTGVAKSSVLTITIYIQGVAWGTVNDFIGCGMV